MKKIISLIFVFLLAVNISGCAGEKNTRHLSVGILPDVDSIPVIIALKNGYFDDEGIKIEVQRLKSAPDRDSALQSGKLDGAVSDILAAAFASDGGFDVRITSMTNGSYKLLVGKDSGILDFKGLKDKSIAISKNTIIEYATDNILEANSLKPDEVEKTVIAQIPVRLEMLQKGKIDAATLPEPLASTALGNGARLLGSTDKLGINPGVLLFTKKACEIQTKEIRAFYKAYNRAVAYLKKEPAESYIDMIIKEAGFPETVKESLVLPSYTKASMPDEKEFNSVVDWLMEKNLIKKPVKYSELVEDRFVREND